MDLKTVASDGLVSGLISIGDTPHSLAEKYKNVTTIHLLNAYEKYVTEYALEDGNGYLSSQDIDWISWDRLNRTQSRSHMVDLHKELKLIAKRKAENRNPIGMENIPFYEKAPNLETLRRVIPSLFSREYVTPIAAHLLIWSQQMQSKITPYELSSYPLLSDERKDRSYLRLFMSFLEDVKRWTEILILSEWDAIDRARNVEFFILLLEELSKCRCFHACFGVVMGLMSPHLERYGKVKLVKENM